MLPYIEILGRQVPMYGICTAFGILIAALLAVSECRRQKKCWEDLVVIATVTICFGYIGAKLLFWVVTYTPREIVLLIQKGYLLELLYGGFVFYGGFIFGVVAFCGISKIMKVKISDYENIAVKALPMAHAFGRIGCFCAGCCYGMPTSSALGVAFTNPLGDAPVGVKLFPTQLFEAGFNFILVAALWLMDRKGKENRFVLPVYLLAYATERFGIEFLRYDVARGLYLGLSTSQWISIVVFAAGLIVLAYRFKESKTVA